MRESAGAIEDVPFHRTVANRSLRRIRFPSVSKVFEPRGKGNGRVRKCTGAVLGKDTVERIRIVPPTSRVTHHDLEEDGPFGTGHKRPEGCAVRQLYVGSGVTHAIAAEDLSLEDHEDMWAEMTMPALDDSRIPFCVQGQIEWLGREGKPLLPHRRDGPVRAADSPYLLPRHIRIV